MVPLLTPVGVALNLGTIAALAFALRGYDEPHLGAITCCESLPSLSNLLMRWLIGECKQLVSVISGLWSSNDKIHDLYL